MIQIGNKVFDPEQEIKNTVTIFSGNQTITFRPIDRVKGVSFKNVGDTDATINGAELNVGDGMLTYSGDPKTCDTSTYRIVFSSPLGANPKIEMHRTQAGKTNFIELELALVKRVGS